MLKKSQIIKDLTSKLKQSTQIISQLYESAANKDNLLKDTIKNNVSNKSQESELAHLREI